MVRIINYKKRETEDGKEFFVLELQGGIEMVKSKETSKFYITARKASISTTFDELTCQALIGTELPGKVEKVECEAYDYTIKDTGEVITLTHRFEYVEEEKATTPKAQKSKTTVDEFMSKTPSENSFSSNGQLQH
ncbi:hypothetical protein H8R23_03400 [Flavobacterium sp. F-380]|uniref:Uncharacterized protein n=1 Tax=Flavobacterium kayseriense TaxID=2764714 RepID=A0ABR7J4G4_9FLAO|nr:hypothetical protein [Flavobacterium kayseriense]MBC5840440.1 hypothetical protein [Flavobacterium kayseriense]MBC5846890.1 hypothetical protein [Flavobacterium kayseriense]